MAKGKPTDAVILAAGKGTRLWPYGDTNPKAALPLGNRPVIHHQLDALASAGVKTVSVVVGYLEGMVRAACASWQSQAKSPLEIHIVPLSSPRGTAYSALSGLTARADSGAPAYLLPGDLYFHPDDLKALAERTKPGSVACLVSPLEERSCQDVVSLEVENGKGKAVHAHSRCAAQGGRTLTGLYAVPADFVRHLAATPEIPTCVEIGAMPPAEQALFETLHQFLRGGGEVLAVEAKERVIDMDRPWDLLEANMLCAERETSVLSKNVLAKGASIDPAARLEGFVKLGAGSKIGPGVIVYGNLIVGANTTITDGAYVGENTLIGDDCKIWRGCLVGGKSVIGHRCVVGHGAEVEGLIMDEAYSYHYGEYWGILGKCCDLGAATVCGTLRFDDGETTHRVKGRKETPRWHSNATYLGDYVRTGVNAILMPGVKAGPYSLIGAGVYLNEDIPNNTAVFVEQTHKKSSWGPERYGW
jgi:bifunctional UDP-N-acetylglucosamine pyrophosphorylase/glucosamine-1-phosphate N-acetyltransferase